MKITSFLSILIIFLVRHPLGASMPIEGEVPPPPPPPLEAPPAAAPAAQPPAPAPATPAPEKAAAPATPEVQAEQLKWPDALELSEEQKGLTQTSNPTIFALFQNAKKITQNADEFLTKMTKSYEDFSKKFEEINAKIDSFLQDTAFSKGKVEEQIQPSLKK